MDDGDWNAPDARRSGCTSTATASPAPTPAAATIIDDHFLLYFNAAGDDVRGDPAAGGVRRRVGRRDRHREAKRRRGPGRGRGHAEDRRPAACWCCASTRAPRPTRTTRWPRRSPPPAEAARPSADGHRRHDDAARAHQHLPAADHRRLRPVRRRRDRCRTCTTSASTGSTSRPLLKAEPGSDHGYDVVDHAGRRPGARRGRGAGRAVRRGAGGWAWACSSTSCPTTSGVADAACERLVVGPAAARPRLGVRRRVRRRLGRRRRPGAHPGARRRRPATGDRGRTVRREVVGALPRPRASRSRPARATPGRAALRAGHLAAGRRPA